MSPFVEELRPQIERILLTLEALRTMEGTQYVEALEVVIRTIRKHQAECLASLETPPAEQRVH